MGGSGGGGCDMSLFLFVHLVKINTATIFIQLFSIHFSIKCDTEKENFCCMPCGACDLRRYSNLNIGYTFFVAVGGGGCCVPFVRVAFGENEKKKKTHNYRERS